MEEQENSNNNSMSKFAIPGVIVLLVIVIAGILYVTKEDVQTENVIGESIEISEASPTSQAVNISLYEDGEYSAKGNYVSPGGPREIEVILTLNNDVITEAEFKGSATDAPSIRFQKEFADNYKALVIGKNIDELSLTKVSGSSLTPKGFNDALEKIKAEAQS